MNKLALYLIAIVTLGFGCGEVVNRDPPDPCANGTCECDVATEDADCGTHQYCNATDTGRTCECVAGYTKGVNGCVWTGAVEDPELSKATTWTPVNGALMNPSAVGGVDPGEASFLPSALCSLAHVKQAVTMPTFARSEPLVLELSYKNQRVFNPGGGGTDEVLMGVAFGDNWSPLPNFGDANFHSVRICLPEGAYAPTGTAGAGAPVTFAVGPYQQPGACPNSLITNFAVDHAAIVPPSAGECGTRFGEGLNADAEGTGGWTFTVSGTSTGGFAAGIGANGSRAARINLGQRCDGARLETTFNVPATANPAFEMFVGAGPGANPTISFTTGVSLSAFPSVSLATQTRTLRMCLPPALRGQTMGVSLSVSGGSGACADVLNLQAFADNVRVVDDPACAADERFTSGGFEQGAAPWGTFGFSGTTAAAAIVRNAPGQARSGTRYLAIESYGRCSSAGYTMMPIVPPSVGPAGPALKFFANVGVNPDATTTVRPRSGTMTQTLTEGGGYRPYTVCLNPLYVGRPQQVFLRQDGGSGLCDTSNYVQQNALIDDVEVTTDPACSPQ